MMRNSWLSALGQHVRTLGLMSEFVATCQGSRPDFRTRGNMAGFAATCISPPDTYNALMNARLPVMDIDFGIKNLVKNKDF